MLETTMLSQVLAANEVLDARVLAADEVGDAKGGGESKRVKPKTGRSESRKSSKGQNLSKSKKPLALEHAFILLRLAFTDIWIETEAAYFLRRRFLEMLNIKLTMQSSWHCSGLQDLEAL